MPTPRIAVIGAGLMGHGIAQVFALAGHDVAITDSHAPTLASAKDRILANLTDLGDDVAEIRKIGENAILGARKGRRMAVRNGDVVAGEGEYLGDAVAHKAGADHGNARLDHGLAPPGRRDSAANSFPPPCG